MSIFKIFAGQTCEVKNATRTQFIKIDCQLLDDFKFVDSKKCIELKNFNPKFAVFPGHRREMNLCIEQLTENISDEKINFIVFGDAGRGQNAARGFEQKRVALAMADLCSALRDHGERCHFASLLGDNFYPDGVKDTFDPMFNNLFEMMYKELFPLPFYVSLGNHDHHGSIKAQIEFSLFNQNWKLPGQYYKTPGLPEWVQIYNIDSTSLIDNKTDFQRQLDSIQQTECPSSWNIIAGHHPAISHGEHGPNTKIQDFLQQSSKKCPIDVYLSGHEHHQELLQYGNTVQVVQGAGGTSLRPVQTVDQGTLVVGNDKIRFMQKFAQSSHGFSLIEVEKNYMNISFYNVSKLQFNQTFFKNKLKLNDFEFRCKILLQQKDLGCQEF